jgi:charged multivesicular body protein 7
MSTLLTHLVETEPSFRPQRLPALYSDFRPQKTLNPDGYQANLSAWRRAISVIASSGLAPSTKGSKPNHLVLTVDEGLLRALESKSYGRPLALGAVFAEAIKDKELIGLKEFLTSKESVYKKGWNLSPWAVAGWALRTVGLVDGLGRTDKLPGGEWVVLANVEAAGKKFGEVSAELNTRFERTFSKAHFSKEFADQIVSGQTMTATDVEVLLRFLSRDKEAVLYDGATVKIRNESTEEGMSLTEEDKSIAHLKELLGYLQHQTEVLRRKVDELNNAAKQAVADKNRVVALATLKSKKIAEASLQARYNTLASLEETAGKIQQASDNVAVVRVMEASGEALKNLNAAVGGTEGVEGVVERLREQMDTADEINTIMNEEHVVIDEGEIDDELAAIEAQEKKKEEEKAAAERKEKEEKEAEETRKRLEAVEAVKPLPEKEGGVEKEVEDTADQLSRITLGSQPVPEPAQ